MNRMFTRKKAKAVKAEPKPELDLSIALPASENFRTSLLMPNLSARFSMLREQDDPNTKIGKAVDDSVLTPNRRSRLYDFQSPYGLDDIAEVASIRSAIRPPFAQQNGRSASYASDGGYNTDDDSSHSGSVMGRARPGEGNVLFGGRQKIYKIAGDGQKGRTLYEDDVGITGFQKYRQGEREREEAERLQELKDIRNGSKGEPYASPVKGPSSVNSSLTRHTSSSTTTSAMDSRSSTAATSINSQGTSTIPNAPPSTTSTFNFSQPTVAAPAPALERSATKRRLYEQGLDRDFQDQQSQQISRLNSIAKGKGALAGNGRTTPDVLNARPAQDRLHRPGMTTFGSSSPTTSSATTSPQLNGKSFANGHNGINGNRNNGFHGLVGTDGHPVSEQVSAKSPQGEYTALASALNPNDRGKATAMGVFNKPQQFSEQQFLERTKTLRKEREVPFRTHSEGLGDSPKESEEIDRDQMQEVRGLNSGPYSATSRSRSTSRGPANRSRSDSSAQRFEPERAVPAPAPIEQHAGVSAFQKAAMQMKAMNAEVSPVKETVREPVKETHQAPPKNRFAFHDDSESDYEEDQPVPSPMPSHPVRLPQIPLLPNIPAAVPITPRHPAFREYSDLPEHPAFRSPKLPEIDLTNDTHAGSNESGYRYGQPKLNNALETESPTLGSASGGLSGMVRQHLRQGSDTSRYSVVQPPANEVTAPTSQTRNLSNASKNYSNTPAHSSHSHSNPWDLDDYDDYGIDNNSPVSPLESSANTPRRDGHRPSQENSDIRRQLLARTAEPSREAPWQEELRKKTHNRGGSSETQAEQEAFTSEVAARQRAIKEQLRAKAESDSRSSSPGPSKSGPFSGLGTLRMKTSRESSQVRDPNAKLAKFPGLNGSSTNVNGHNPSPPASAISDRPSYDRWKSDRSDRSEQPPRSDPRQRSRSRADTTRSREPVQPFPPYSNGMATAMSSQSASRSATGRESDERMRSRADSNVNSTRSRSNSEHSANGRSRSRGGRYRDDLAEAMAVGNSSRTTVFPEATPAIPEQYATDFPAQVPVPEHPIPAIPHSLKESNALRLQQAAFRDGEFRPRPLERKMSDNRENRQLESNAFEHKGLWPSPANGFGIPSPRPSPGYPPTVPAYSPAVSHGLSPRPSPGLGGMSPGLMSNSRGSPFAGNPTPPVSASSTPLAPTFPGGNQPSALSSSTFSRKPTNRKMSIKKTEISEPRLISTTSVIDTVDLPAGASLMNGMHDVPPVPAFNPRRKRFGFGRGDLDVPEPPFVTTQYNSLSADERERQPRSKHRIRKSSSDGAKIGLHIRAQQQGLAAMKSTPTLPHKMSPPRHGKAVEGGMF